MSAPNLLDTFHAKYEEFAADLVQTFPELNEEVAAALAIEKVRRSIVYTSKVLIVRKGLPSENLDKTPGLVLPGVTITQELWDSVSDKTRKVIHEYVSIWYNYAT